MIGLAETFGRVHRAGEMTERALRIAGFERRLAPNNRCAVVNCRSTAPSPPSHGWKRRRREQVPAPWPGSPVRLYKAGQRHRAVVALQDEFAVALKKRKPLGRAGR